MIDIHTHVLPGLDDGAANPGQALEMVRMAAAAGTTDIVATPHASPEFAFLPQRVEDAIAELQRAAGRTPRIHYGCELHFTLDNIEEALEFPEKYTLNHRSYLLVEFSDFLVPRTAGEILGRLIRRGMQPIVAHPERNRIFQKSFSDLESWVSEGCFLQVTAQSMIGSFGRSAKTAADRLLDQGLVHFVASDGHSVVHRPPVLDHARACLETRFGTETAERLLVTNPKAVLSGASLEAVEGRAKRRWFALR